MCVMLIHYEGYVYTFVYVYQNILQSFYVLNHTVNKLKKICHVLISSIIVGVFNIIDKISNIGMPPCSVQLQDILDFNDPEQHCYFPTKCGIKT